MTIKIRTGGWSNNELIIETERGEAKVRMEADGDIKIENEAILLEFGLTLSDAIALFFDRAASQGEREKYPTYLAHRGGPK